MNPAFIFHELKNFSAEKTAQGLFLVLLKADRIPPHLGLLIESRWFTLDVRGATGDADAQALLQAIERKKIASVFVHLAWPRGLSAEQGRARAKEIFEAYPALGKNEDTCYSPIRDFISAIYGEAFQRTNFVFELLKLLQDNNLLIENFGAHLPAGEFSLLAYGMSEVRASIAAALETGAAPR